MSRATVEGGGDFIWGKRKGLGIPPKDTLMRNILASCNNQCQSRDNFEENFDK